SRARRRSPASYPGTQCLAFVPEPVPRSKRPPGRTAVWERTKSVSCYGCASCSWNTMLGRPGDGRPRMHGALLQTGPLLLVPHQTVEDGEHLLPVGVDALRCFASRLLQG